MLTLEAAKRSQILRNTLQPATDQAQILVFVWQNPRDHCLRQSR